MNVPGWLSDAEGHALTKAAAQCPNGPIVEIGSWCGKSTLRLAEAAYSRRLPVFAIDTFRGSPEHQPGRPHHDPRLMTRGQVDTLPMIRWALEHHGYESTVTTIVGRHETIEPFFGEVAMLFIDGDHERALDDWRAWERHLMYDGILALHDVGTHRGPTELRKHLDKGWAWELTDSLAVGRHP